MLYYFRFITGFDCSIELRGEGMVVLDNTFCGVAEAISTVFNDREKFAHGEKLVVFFRGVEMFLDLGFRADEVTYRHVRELVLGLFDLLAEGFCVLGDELLKAWVLKKDVKPSASVAGVVRDLRDSRAGRKPSRNSVVRFAKADESRRRLLEFVHLITTSLRALPFLYI